MEMEIQQISKAKRLLDSIFSSLQGRYRMKSDSFQDSYRDCFTPPFEVVFCCHCNVFFSWREILMMLVHVNVGPGCSSVGVGAFSENGPFRPSGNVLVRNEYSWNKGERFLQVVVTAPKQNFWCTLAPFGWSFFSVEKGQKNCEVLISFLVPVCCSRGQRAVFGEPCRSWLLILY